MSQGLNIAAHEGETQKQPLDLWLTKKSLFELNNPFKHVSLSLRMPEPKVVRCPVAMLTVSDSRSVLAHYGMVAWEGIGDFGASRYLRQG